MKRNNILLIVAVIVLAAVPLWIVQKPAPDADGNQVEIFAGADDKAKDLITVIDPNYRPWFKSIIEPASSEIASLLFALQAALGAGFIGYYLGVGVTREKMRRESEKNAKSSDLSRTATDGQHQG